MELTLTGICQEYNSFLNTCADVVYYMGGSITLAPCHSPLTQPPDIVSSGDKWDRLQVFKDFSSFPEMVMPVSSHIQCRYPPVNNL